MKHSCRKSDFLRVWMQPYVWHWDGFVSQWKSVDVSVDTLKARLILSQVYSNSDPLHAVQQITLHGCLSWVNTSTKSGMYMFGKLMVAGQKAFKASRFLNDLGVWPHTQVWNDLTADIGVGLWLLAQPQLVDELRTLAPRSQIRI